MAGPSGTTPGPIRAAGTGHNSGPTGQRAAASDRRSCGPRVDRNTPTKPRRVVNRLNDLDGKQWLPFQKSWFLDGPGVYEAFIRFFTKRRRPDGTPAVVLTLADTGPSGTTPGTIRAALAGAPADRAVAAAATAAGRRAVVWDPDQPPRRPVAGHMAGPSGTTPGPIRAAGAGHNSGPAGQPAGAGDHRSCGPRADYVLVDLRGRLPTLVALRTFLQRTAPLWSALGQADAGHMAGPSGTTPGSIRAAGAGHNSGPARQPAGAGDRRSCGPRDMLRERGYVTVLIDNTQQDGKLCPVAWELARYLAGRLARKDEKIGCQPPAAPEHAPHFATDGRVYYALNFRCEAIRSHEAVAAGRWPEAGQPAPRTTAARPRTGSRVCSWFVPRPLPREPGVRLHPAKYPEPLVAEFVERLTQPGELVLDPMAGTGSTLLACHRIGRRGFGVELYSEYAAIARQRLAAAGGTPETARVVVGDARRLTAIEELPPQVDYCITSPPYWDMLNMRGAMTQRGRRQRGLPVSYGDDPCDVGNVAAYGQFVAALVRVYRQVAARLRPGGYLTVIVKNVKKQGVVYPLAWDLAAALAEFLQVCPERIWCQDDVKLAPYGYGNAWVSNTVHHYCLTFRKTC